MAKKEENLDDMVIGAILFHRLPVSVLFNFGASHYFISYAFITQYNIPCENLNFSWNISWRNENIISSKIFRLCLVVACKREFYTNLLVNNTHEFGVILCMDSLSTFYVVIDCWKRSIVFRVRNHSEFKFVRGNN